MALVVIDDSSLYDIGDSIRAQLGVQTTYMPSEMAAAIDSIEGGSIYDMQVLNGVYAGRNIEDIPEIATEVAGYDAPWLFLSARIDDQDYSGLRIGDYFNVPLTTGTGTITQSSVRYDIAAFEHYYNCGDDGHVIGHHIVCVPHAPIDMTGSSYAVNTSYINWNTTGTNQGTSAQHNPYIVSNLHAWELNEYLGLLPSSLQAKLIDRRAICESRYNSASSSNSSAWDNIGKIWTPSEVEIIGRCKNGTRIWSEGIDSRFPIFSNSSKLIMAGRDRWWLRTVGDSSTNNVCYVHKNSEVAGDAGANDAGTKPYPCFMLGA